MTPMAERLERAASAHGLELCSSLRSGGLFENIPVYQPPLLFLPRVL